tara:strand:- start:34 stop:675 length:642 start_codon:yes stop_codon:yes gene_type:complete
MVNYKNGKIYKILDLTNDNFYIGSTTKEYLSQRLEKHRTHYKDYLQGRTHYRSSFEILCNENYKIYLLENAPCASKDELRQREQYWIDRLNCIKLVNKLKAFRTEEDIKQYKKEYYENNKEQLAEKGKIYRENNKEKIAERGKIYRENNKEQIAEKKKEYYENNKEQIAKRTKENVQCPRCNAIVRKYGFKRHQKSNSCIHALKHGLICELAE